MEVFRLEASWVKGLTGTQFTFTNEFGRKATVTIDSQDKDRARLTVEDRVDYCSAVEPTPARRPFAIEVQGQYNVR